MFGATNIAKNSDNDKWVYGSYGIAFNGEDRWSLGNGTARKIIIFGFDNSSLSYADNLKNNLLILGKLLELMEALAHLRKNLVLISLKQIQTFARFYIIMLIIVTCLLMGKIIKFKADKKNLTFRLNFV